jgi:uncharacterized membrane protein YkoI
MSEEIKKTGRWRFSHYRIVMRRSCGVQAGFVSWGVWIFQATQPNQNTMKIKMIVCSALAASLLAGCAWEKSERGEGKGAKLMAEAKVSKETAQASALAKVPGGTVKDAELEKEKGKLIWSFDIAIPDSKDIKEVAVNAITGDVIAVETETPADQAKEAAEDAAKANKKKGGDKEDKD